MALVFCRTRHLLALSLLLGATPVFAGVTLVNYDRTEYEISIQCKADQTPMDDIIATNGMLDLEQGPCTSTVKGGDQLVAADNEIVELRNGKLTLQ